MFCSDEDIAASAKASSTSYSNRKPVNRPAPTQAQASPAQERVSPPYPSNPGATPYPYQSPSNAAPNAGMHIPPGMVAVPMPDNFVPPPGSMALPPSANTPPQAFPGAPPFPPNNAMSPFQGMPAPPLDAGAPPKRLAIDAHGNLINADTGQPVILDKHNQQGYNDSRLKPWEANPEWKHDLPPSPVDDLKESLDW